MENEAPQRAAPCRENEAPQRAAPRAQDPLLQELQGCEVNAAFPLAVRHCVLLGGIQFALLSILPLNFNDARKEGNKGTAHTMQRKHH